MIAKKKKKRKRKMLRTKKPIRKKGKWIYFKSTRNTRIIIIMFVKTGIVGDVYEYKYRINSPA